MVLVLYNLLYEMNLLYECILLLIYCLLNSTSNLLLICCLSPRSAAVRRTLRDSISNVHESKTFY